MRRIFSKGLRKRRFRMDTNVCPVFHLPLFNRPHIFTETLLNNVRPWILFNVEFLQSKNVASAWNHRRPWRIDAGFIFVL